MVDVVIILGPSPGELGEVEQKKGSNGRRWGGLAFQAGGTGLTRTWNIRELGVFGESLSCGSRGDSQLRTVAPQGTFGNV